MRCSGAPLRNTTCIRPSAAAIRRVAAICAASIQLLVFGGICAATQKPSVAAGPGTASDPRAINISTEDGEIKLGRQAAEENDKHIRLVTDAAMVERVNRIGQEIAAVANVTEVPAGFGSPNVKPFHYIFKIVDDKDVQAYSLPGGFIYVNKGLVDYCHSDDELAGVLAHEITHAAHHHVIKLLREENKMKNYLLPAIALIMLAGRGAGSIIPQALETGNLVGTAVMNSFSVTAEEDADHGAILFLTHTHYNPVGLYSFMLRLAADERSQDLGELGIFRTHPPTPQRVAAAKALLDKLGIPIRLGEVDPTLNVMIVPVPAGAGDLQLVDLKMRGVVLCRIAPADSTTAEDRAKKVAAQLNKLVDAGLQPYEIRVSSDQTCVLARGVRILTLSDAQAAGKTIQAAAHDLGSAIANVNERALFATPLSDVAPD